MRARSILFINRVYPPADGATGRLLAELAPALTRVGWEVTVITGQTNPQSRRSEKIKGVRVERVGGLPFTRASHWRRALSYLSLYPALLWRALRLPCADVVVTLTDPPLQLVLGAALKCLKGSKHVHWAQDLYPELAEEMDVLSKNGRGARLLRWLSTAALRHSDRIIAVGRCMKARLEQRGLPTDAIQVIPNWGLGLDDAGCAADESVFRREHGLEDKFVVMYSGNFGLAHPFEAMLGAAEHLQASSPRVVLVFVGDGPRLSWVRDHVRQRQLSNVLFLPFQPAGKLRQSLAAADLHLASMRAELCGLVVPSKVYGVLAAGRPCVFLGPEGSEAAQLILRHGCGSVLPRATGARLASCITQWVNQPGQLQDAGLRAAALKDQLGVTAAADAFNDILQSLVVSSGSATLTRAPRQKSPLTRSAKPFTTS